MLIEALIAALNALKPSLRAKVRRTIRQHGVPTNDNELLLLATSLSHELRPQRHRAWELCRRYYVSEALRNGVVADAFAPERMYPTKAMVSGIRRALEWDEGTPGPTVNLELLDPETKRLSMSKLDVTSANRRDKRVVDKFTDKLQPTVERHMLAAGRDAMVDSVESAARKSRVKITDNSTTDLRWARVLTGGENCPFCAMLASRGPVYHNATTALIDGKSVRMDAYHDNCDCIAVPVFGDDTQWQGYEQWQALEAKWQKLTKDAFSRGKYKDFRKDFDKWFAEDKDQYVIWDSDENFSVDNRLLDAETLRLLREKQPGLTNAQLAKRFYAEKSSEVPSAEKKAKVDRDLKIKRLAQKYHSQAVKNEPIVTENVVKAMKAGGGYPERLDTAVKSLSSLTRKIRSDLLEKSDESPESVAADMKDVVRYTCVVPMETYWEDGDRVRDTLLNASHSDGIFEGGECALLKDPRYWRKDEYLGRNMAFESPDGQKFEVQIHTKDSLEAAEKTHPLYEKKRADDTPQPERDRLQVEMNKIFSKVPIPPNTVWSDS